MKNIVILLFCFITVFSYSQNFTLRFKLNYSGDTIFYERVSHYFEPVSIITTDVGKTIDSLREVRIAFLDSLENERISKAYTIYYDPTHKYNTYVYELEFDPTDKLLDTLGIIPKDSVIFEDMISRQILDSLSKLRLSLNKNELIFSERINYDCIYDSKIYLLNNIKSPTMIFDNEKYSNYCECYKEITNSILSVKKYKRKILSNKTKSIYVTFLRRNNGLTYVLLRFERKNIIDNNLLILD
jgi:hypothetical protein